MEAKANIWYRLGYAWETARLGPATGNGGTSGRRRPPFRSGNGSTPSATRKIASSLLWRNLLDEAGGLARRVVGGRAVRSPARGNLPRAALAGAGAALAARSLARLLASDASSGDDAGDDPGLGLELAQGAAEGLALAALSRHLPSGRLLQIGLCSAARYAAASRGGLPRVIRPIAPGTIRTLSALAPASGRSGGLLEHAAFAAAFVLLYGRRTAGSGEQINLDRA